MTASTEPPPQPVDAFQATQVLTSPERGPLETREVSVLSFQAPDDLHIEEQYSLPDGRTILSCSGYEKQDFSVALDPKGQELWKFRPDDEHEIESHLFLSNGTTFVQTKGKGAWPSAQAICLDAQGNERWKFESEDREPIDSIQADPAGNLFVKLGQDVVKLDPNGKQLWRVDLSIHSDEYWHIQTPDHAQLFASDDFSNTFRTPSFCLVSPDGKVKEVDLPDCGSFPHEQNGMLFYGGAQGQARGIDLKTLKAWEVQTDSAVGGLYTPFGGPDGRIYFPGRRDDKLYCLSQDGKMLWQRTIEDDAPGMGVETGFKPDKDGSVYYANRDGETIQQIKPDGQLGQQIRVPGGFESFQPGQDGCLYSVDRDAVIRRHDLAKGTTFELKLKLPESIRWELDAVEPGGIVTLTDKLGGVFHKLRVDPQDAVKRELEEIKNAPPPQGSPGVKEGDGWVIIGNVRVKRRGA
jgi:outer membrane protein assembly factor BamB